MAFKDPRELANAIAKPLNIANPQAAITGGQPKIQTTLIHNPLTQGYDKNSDQYKSFIKQVFSNLDDYKKTPEYKKAALDAIFGKDDVDYKNFHKDLRAEFLKKYNYDEDLGNIAPVYLGDFDMEWRPTNEQADRNIIGKKNSLTNLLSDSISLDDIRDYFSKPYEDKLFESEQKNPLYWAQRVLEEPDEYPTPEVRLAHNIIDRFGGK